MLEETFKTDEATQHELTSREVLPQEVTNILPQYTLKALDKIRKCDATFDGRVIPIPVGSEIEIVNNIIWRSCYDCYRNTISSYARYKLGSKTCVNKNGHEMMQMMTDKGFDFKTEVPTWYKYGVLCKKLLIERLDENNEKFYRSVIYNFCTNLIQQDRSKTLELFFATYYSELIDSQRYSTE